MTSTSFSYSFVTWKVQACTALLLLQRKNVDMKGSVVAPKSGCNLWESYCENNSIPHRRFFIKVFCYSFDIWHFSKVRNSRIKTINTIILKLLWLVWIYLNHHWILRPRFHVFGENTKLAFWLCLHENGICGAQKRNSTKMGSSVWRFEKAPVSVSM